MDQEQTKKFHLMPNDLRRGLSKYVSKEEGLSIQVKVMIIIGIFSLILISLGTIILLDSYSPHATTVNTNTMVYPTKQATNTISIPQNITKTNLSAVGSSIENFQSGLANDEQAFEAKLQ
jgi:hypothetical protein